MHTDRTIDRIIRAALLAIGIGVMVFAAAGAPAFAYAEDTGAQRIIERLADSYEGKTVILQSNDVHGKLDRYRNMAGLRNELADRGADVYLVDSGDFLQGSQYVAFDKGKSLIPLMNAVGYDLVALGNHEFDYGYDALTQLLQRLEATALCNNVLDEKEKCVFDRTAVIENDGVKIGFFGVATPETKTKASASHTQGLTFLSNQTNPTMIHQAEEDVRALKKDGADIVIGLTHLGADSASAPNRSNDLWKGIRDDGIDLILDAHSHDVMTQGDEGEAIMSTGTLFQYIGMVIIDESEKAIEDRGLYPVTGGTWSDPKVKAISDRIIAEADEIYGGKIGETEVELNCFDSRESASKSSWTNGNRDGETNTGDLVADAYRWYALNALKSGKLGGVKEDHVVGLTNGGSIRSGGKPLLGPGDLTRMDIANALPYGNMIEGIYVTGEELLEVLEASTAKCPDEPIAGFPQVSGIDYTIDSRIAYYPREDPYPNSQEHGPKYIRRVKINNVNGKPFSPKDTYVVAANDFVGAGGDTYNPFARARKVGTGGIDEQVVCEYIAQRLEGTVGEEYKAPAGRIEIKTGEAGEVIKGPNPLVVKTSVKKVKVKKLKKKAVSVAVLTVKNKEGKIRYAKASGSSKLTVDTSSGKVKVKKGTRKGTYRIAIDVTAAGNSFCEKKTVRVTAKVKVVK